MSEARSEKLNYPLQVTPASCDTLTAGQQDLFSPKVFFVTVGDTNLDADRSSEKIDKPADVFHRRYKGEWLDAEKYSRDLGVAREQRADFGD